MPLIPIFFIAGMILSGSLAYAGLVHGRLQLSKDQPLTGNAAKYAGLACLLIMLTLLGGVVWTVLTAINSQ